MINCQAKAQEVYEQGFCVLEGLFSAEELADMTSIFEEHWRAKGSPPMENWGFGINPVAVETPGLVPYYARPEIVETLKLVLGDEVRLVHAGARMSDVASDAAIGWHQHYGGWDESALATREKIERLLVAIYVEGSNDAIGPLVVLPRGANDPLGETPADVKADLPGQVVAQTSPGAVVIFDTTLWHTAHRGNQPGTRHLFGAHLQGWSETRPHPEDNACDVPEVAKFKAANPLLRGLLERPAQA